MFHHIGLGKTIFARNRKLKSLIEKGEIVFGGNRKLKIYETLLCKSGKRMKTETRVFFNSEKEAVEHGYRPCGNCMKEDYKNKKTDVCITAYTL